MLRKELSYSNRKLVYHTSGDGPLILFIHGFGETWDIWKLLIKSFKNFKVVLPDLPGSGESDIYFGEMADYARVLCLLIDIENTKSDKGIILVGHSMGGYISLEMAKLHPEKIASLCLFHSSMFADSDEKVATRKKGIEFIRRNGSYQFLKSAIPNLFSLLSQQKMTSEINKLIECAQFFRPEVLIHYYEIMISRLDQTTFMSNVNFPVLLIGGEEDKAVPLPNVLAQSHISPITELLILKNVAHMGMLEAPDDCVKIIKSFLARFVS